MRIAVAHQLLEHAEVRQQQPVPLVHAPVGVRAVHQVPAVQGDGFLQIVRLRAGQPGASHVARRVPGALEGVDVEPPVGISVEADPARGQHEELGCEPGLQLPERLPQVLATKRRAGVRPEERRQLVAAVRAITVEQQQAQEFERLGRQVRQRLSVLLDRDPPQQPYANRHAHSRSLSSTTS